MTPEQIAAKLTASAKELLETASYCSWINGFRIFGSKHDHRRAGEELYDLGLISFGGELLASGLAVRATLIEQEQGK